MAKYNLNVEGVSVEAVFNKVGGVEGARRLIRGETRVVPVGGNILIIDRSIAPTYPDWVDLSWDKHGEYVGVSTHLDLSALPLYLHPEQENGGSIAGKKLYGFLKDSGLIKHCLDLRVGEELVKHPHLWPAAWKGLYLPLWKSVVRHAGRLRIPCVCEYAGRVGVNWSCLDDGWGDGNPAVLSAS